MKFEFDTTNLKKQVEENPLLAMGVFAATATAGSKLLNTFVAAKNSRTYRKEVDRRIKKSKK